MTDPSDPRWARKTGNLWHCDRFNPAIADVRFGIPVGFRGFRDRRFANFDGKWGTAANFVGFKADEPSVAIFSYGFDEAGAPAARFEVAFEDWKPGDDVAGISYFLLWPDVCGDMVIRDRHALEPGDNVLLVFRDLVDEELEEFISSRAGRPFVSAFIRAANPENP